MADHNFVCQNFGACGDSGLKPNQLGRVAVRLSRLDINYLVLPMFHIYGALVAMITLVQGVKIILENRFDLISLFQQIEKHKVR